MKKKSRRKTCKPRRWTAQENRVLKQLVGEGKDVPHIARILDRSERSVYCRKYALGLHRCSTSYKFSPRNPLLLAQIIKFKMAGWKLKDIAKVFGGDAGDISYVLCENGFKGFMWQRPTKRENYRFWTEQEVSLLQIYLEQDLGFDEIHKKMPDRTINAIRRKAKQIPLHLPQSNGLLEVSRRSPAELNQAVRNSLIQHPDKPDAWHAQHLETLEKTIEIVRADIRIRG